MTSRFGDELVARVREANDIVAVVSDYVQLRKAGNRLIGLCPFHNERTPSFSVSREKQLFYCFGCHAGGNVFTFVMKLEGVDFREAVRRLANRAGIDVAYEDESPVQRAARERRERAYEANELAMAYYKHVLMDTPQGAEARSYLAKRGIGREASEKFGIGYAPQGWNSLVSALAKRGIMPQAAVECGLALADRGTGRIYDRFRNRVMFPIVNLYGRVIGFGGRAHDGSSPKYLNSPESAVFSKRMNLYGINLAADSIRGSGKAVLVEGYIDVISSAMVGLPNTVATLGTAMTVEQAKLIARLANEVVLCYDGDAAGSAATVRAVEIAESVGLNARVAPLPGEHDPDSLVRAEGPGALHAAIDGAVPFARYRIEQIVSGVDMSKLESRVRAAEAVIEVLAPVASDVERSEYVREVSDRLSMDPQALAGSVRKAVAARNAQRSREQRGSAASMPGPIPVRREAFRPAAGSSSDERAYFEVERWFLLLALASEDALRHIAQEIGEEGFRTEPNKTLFGLMMQASKAGEHMDAAALVDAAGEELGAYVSELAGADHAFDMSEGAAHRAVDLWRRRRIQDRLAQIDSKVREAEAEGDGERVRALMEEQVRLRQLLGRNITLY